MTAKCNHFFARALCVLLVLGGGLCHGCARPSRLETDVLDLLKRNGVTAAATASWNSARTRGGLVEITGASNDVQRIIKSLKLNEASVGKTDTNWRVVLWRKQARAIHNHDHLADSAPVTIYTSGTRPKELLLPNGSQFEYLLLYVPKEGNRLLIQIAYAYG